MHPVNLGRDDCGRLFCSGPHTAAVPLRDGFRALNQTVIPPLSPTLSAKYVFLLGRYRYYLYYNYATLSFCVVKFSCFHFKLSLSETL